MQFTQRSLRHHLLAYSAITLALTLGVMVAVAWWPLHLHQHSTSREGLIRESALRARVVDETLQRLSDTGWQIANHPVAKALTLEALRGTGGREEASRLLAPPLRDALESSLHARALLRMDPEGILLASTGIPFPAGCLRDDGIALEARPGTQHRPGRQRLGPGLVVDASPHLLVRTPVHAPDNQLLATDVLLCDLGALTRILTLDGDPTALASFALVEPAGASRSAKVVVPLSQEAARRPDPGHLLPVELPASGAQLVELDDRWICLVPLHVCSWWLAVDIPASHLPGGSTGWWTGMLGLVLLAGMGGLAGSLALMRPLRERILASQEDLHRQVEELELVRHRQEAQTAALLDRNEDLRHFAYASAHDLKSPLITIGGHAQMLLNRLGPDLEPDRRKSLEFILAGSKRMFQHVNDMLDYARAAEIEPNWQRVSLEGLAQDICSALDARMKETGARVAYGDLPVIQTDRTLLRMILQNLVDNALRYREPDRAPLVEILAECGPDETVIRVRDNGLGISPDHQPQVFETFYRLHDDASIPGTGLGLAICQRAARRLGGSIDLESEPGRGSCFTIHVPQPMRPEREPDATSG